MAFPRDIIVKRFYVLQTWYPENPDYLPSAVTVKDLNVLRQVLKGAGERLDLKAFVYTFYGKESENELEQAVACTEYKLNEQIDFSTGTMIAKDRFENGFTIKWTVEDLCNWLKQFISDEILSDIMIFSPKMREILLGLDDKFNFTDLGLHGINKFTEDTFLKMLTEERVTPNTIPEYFRRYYEIVQGAGLFDFDDSNFLEDDEPDCNKCEDYDCECNPNNPINTDDVYYFEDDDKEENSGNNLSESLRKFRQFLNERNWPYVSDQVKNIIGNRILKNGVNDVRDE